MRKLILLLTLASAALAQNGFYLKPGDRVVFYGDSITDQRLYTTFVETYIVTRFPNMPVTFVHSGWGGDRVTGGGGGPIDQRIERDINPYRPTVVTVMLGMNDGGYRAFDPHLFEIYSGGYQHLVDKIKKDNPGVRLTLIEPSPYDDVTRAPTFEGGYNATLVRYSEFVKQLAEKEGALAADLNTPVVQNLERAKEIDPALAAKLIPDRVHPGPAGHMLMAEALLKAWAGPSVVSDVEIDAASGKAVHTENTRVSNIGHGSPVSWEQLDRCLPMPIDWNANDKLAPLAIKSSDFLGALDRETMRVSNLANGLYILRIDNVEAGRFSASTLASGINLATLAATPMMKQAMDVHALTIKRAGIHNVRWRNVQTPLEADKLPSAGPAMAALDRLDEELAKEQRAAAQPKPHRFELAPVAGK